MATTTKKKSTSAASRKKRTSTAKGKTTSAKKTASTKRASGKRNARRRPDYRPRLIGGAVCFALAVFSAFGYFNIQAVVIDLLVQLERGLFGYGYWVTPVMLLWAAIVLILHNGMPVRLRTVSALVTPTIVGALVQCITWSSGYALQWSMFPELWSRGLEMTSGGALGGALANLLVTAFSRFGAIPICILALFSILLILTRTTPADLLRSIREANDRRRERREQRIVEEEAYQADLAAEYGYDDEPQAQLEPRRDRQSASSRVTRPKRGKRSQIDIPIDNTDAPEGETPTPVQETPAAEPTYEDQGTGRMPIFRKKDNAPLMEEKKESFIDKFFDSQTPEVEEPAGTYRVKGSPNVGSPEVSVEKPADILLDQKKNGAKERAQAAAQVAKELDESMEQHPVQEYVHPPVELLGMGKAAPQATAAQNELREVQERLNGTIQDFGVDAHVVGAVRGPTVTRYELELERGVKLSKVTNLADDIALTLGVQSVRIAPIPGKSLVVGVEVPNRLVTPVPIRQVIDSPEFRNHKSNVAFAVGKDISGRNVVGNISKLPHMLIAGTTGSGKSVCTNSIICSLLYKSSPDQVRLIMIDPKMVELSVYNGIPHLLIPVVTDPKKAAGSLQWAVTEMLKRYRLFSERHVRDLESYNLQVSNDPDAAEEEHPLPQIVIFIDELADLMLVSAKEVEESICRIAQMGRAAGMHLIIATQRPSTDVITGLMKANIPSRIALSVASGLESRIILDTTGAEKLVGNGDMLFSPVGSGKPQRVQGCFISEEEIAQIVEFIKERCGSDYDEQVTEEIEHNAENIGKGSKKGGSTLPDSTIPEPAPASGPSPEDGDPMLNEAIDVVVETGMASVSMLQRRLKLGYSRAARLVDQMEEKGIVGPFEGSKPRKVLVSKDQWAEMKMRGGTVTTFGEASAISDAADREAQDSVEAEDVDMPPFEV
ncbi:MAG: DNA translocase FtsK [Clostridiales bacterium]|nr:DNA translocase FtsK [Clostridiales bacterium]